MNVKGIKYSAAIISPILLFAYVRTTKTTKASDQKYGRIVPKIIHLYLSNSKIPFSTFDYAFQYLRFS